jgi:hypothetical protein
LAHGEAAEDLVSGGHRPSHLHQDFDRAGGVPTATTRSRVARALASEKILGLGRGTDWQAVSQRCPYCPAAYFARQSSGKASPVSLAAATALTNSSVTNAGVNISGTLKIGLVMAAGTKA